MAEGLLKTLRHEAPKKIISQFPLLGSDDVLPHGLVKLQCGHL